MEPWNNAEKVAVVDAAGRLIVEEGWKEEDPLNALYHAQFKVLAHYRTVDRANLLEDSGWGDKLLVALENKVKKLRKS